MFDARTEKILATLIEPAQEPMRAFMSILLNILPVGVTAKAISGLRTFEEQDALYAQGRSKPGEIVTNARAGFSSHNWGTAIDIGLFTGSAYLPESKLYRLVGKAAEKAGLEWGGNWKSIQDEPHVEWIPAAFKGMADKQRLVAYRAKHDAGEPIA